MSKLSNNTWFNELPTPSLILDCRGGIVAFNPAAKAILGPMLEQWNAQHSAAFERLNDQDLPDSFPPAAGSTTFSRRVGLCQPQGKVYWLDLNIQPLPEGNLIVALANPSQEDCEHSQLRAQLCQCQKLENLGILAGGVAHDMNNVLGAILGLATSLRESQTEGSALTKPLEVITHACDRGRTLVRGLLDFSRKDTKAKQDVDLNALVMEEVHLLERTTLQRVRLLTRLDETLNPIQGDPAELSHVIMNLCVNALDAMPQGGSITLCTKNEGQHVLLSVEDTGCGIPQEIQGKVMDPFFTTKEPGKGTGLGLTIVRSAVKAHHGEIQIQSSPDKGTKVTLLFPVASARGISPLPAPIRTDTTAIGNLLVLAVDDDELVRYSLDISFQTLGLKSVIASSGEEALSILEQGLRPGIVILNVNMPGLGGRNTLTRIRLSHPDLPVLLTTGHVDQGLVDFVKTCKGVEIFAKPFTINEMRDRLEAMQSLGAARDQDQM